MSENNRLLAAGLEMLWNCTNAAVTFASTSESESSPTTSGCITRDDSNDERQSFPPPTVEGSRDLPAWMMATVPLYGVMCAVGLTGNALVVGVVMRNAAMRSSVTNNYIVNLAVSDFCFLSGLPLLMVTVVKQGWIFGEAVCKLFYALTAVNWFSSVFTLTVLSADRYFAVCHALDSRRYRTPRTARFVCAAIWAVSLVAMFPVYLGARTVTEVIDADDLDPCSRSTSFSHQTTSVPSPSSVAVSCTLQWPDNQTFSAEQAFMWYAFALSFAIPVSLISVFYALVVVRLKSVGPQNRSLHQHPRQLQQQPEQQRFVNNLIVPSLSKVQLSREADTRSRHPGSPTAAIESISGQQCPLTSALSNVVTRRNHRRRPHRRVTQLVLTVITVYVVCWLPYWVFQVVGSLLDEAPPRWAIAMFQYFTALTYANSAVNPVLYAFLSENFRKTFAASFQCTDDNVRPTIGQDDVVAGGTSRGLGSTLFFVRRLVLFGDTPTPDVVADPTVSRSPQANRTRCCVSGGHSSGDAPAIVDVAGCSLTTERRRRPTPRRRRNRGRESAEESGQQEAKHVDQNGSVNVRLTTTVVINGNKQSIDAVEVGKTGSELVELHALPLKTADVVGNDR